MGGSGVKASLRFGLRATIFGIFLIGSLPDPAPGADTQQPWERQGGVPAETDFLLDRMEEPQNHFLLNGQEGFVSGRDFYQSAGDAMPFLWPAHPFLRFGSDRGWETDSSTFAYTATGSNALDEGASPLSQGELAWSPLEALRLHMGLDQNGLYSQRTLASRKAISTAERKGEWAWYGGDAPIKSQANAGVAFSRRGSTMAAQVNQGWWWTTSPASGQAYPWEGFNAELVYHEGEDFDLTLVEQQWDSPSPFEFYKSHWRRSEINMSFLGSSAGAWLWRFDIGYERRAMNSNGVFAGFEEKTYPFRFRYRQDWAAPDSIPLRVLSQGVIGYREGMFLAQHGSEFRENLGTHQPMQFIKAYYRYPFKDYTIATEQLTGDSQFVATYRPGKQARGVTSGAEYREVRKHFLAGIGGDYALEWELPLFAGGVMDTLAGLVRRQGGYEGSHFLLQNATGKAFASGELGAKGNWRFQAGMRQFWGHDEPYIEFVPSPWWGLAGGGWAFPTKTRLDAQVAYLGPKEIRGWGPIFEVASHWENNFSVTQTLFSDNLKLVIAGLHAFGADFREQPNGNPVRFRVAAGLEGSIE